MSPPAFLVAGCAYQDEGAVPPAPTAPAPTTGGEDSFDFGEIVEVTGAVVADGGTFGKESAKVEIIGVPLT